jgi:hypothetical protein
MRIRLTKNYSTYRVGDAIDCEDEAALRLIAEGMAVRDRQGMFVETADLTPAVERADVTPRRRGRPPKVRYELP